MYCPFCSKSDTKVIDSRLVGEGKQVRRRRECTSCNERFTTYEVAELIMPRIIKRNQVRQPFDEEKLRQGMRHALQKRPISTEQFEEAIQRIIHKLHTTGEREITSQVIGEIVIGELKKIDQVAYVRFASIYRSFQDVEAFNTEIKKLQRTRQTKKQTIFYEKN
ncbi:MAG: transcriptional regulator NrdR [Coxiellaceae bacterium]|jgi:transcriptional repressor NrdR|nr:transcriptional regulator NrdR [Coxiellaceae bacterium]